MKSYTDIEQSKKLAEILPVESADQTWEIIAMAGANLDVPEKMEYWHNGNTPCFLNSKIGIPCWSLAALIDQLEDVICDEDGNEYELVIKKEGVQYDIYYLNICGEQEIIELDRFYDDLIDCCYEMILKLKERNLL